jgi:hypothetical protein
MDKNAFECGAGWHPLIDPLVKRCEDLGGTIDQVKEKFGGLRFYYTEHGPASEELWTQFQDMVDEAESHSQSTCELCGARGVLMSKASWYKTLCKRHATELGYST